MNERIAIDVVTGGTLSEHLSDYVAEGGPVGRARVDTEHDQTVAGLLEQLGIAVDKPLLLIVNGHVIGADTRAAHRLSDGDQVSLAPPIRAG